MFGHQDNQQDENHSMDNGINAIMGNDVTPPPLPNGQFAPPGSSNTTQPFNPSQDDTPLLPAHSDAPLGTNELLDIKQQALTQLSPLVGHLEQSPEEKFRTTMMMIQASDNQALIKDAYAAAQQISDEKARAQALLDVVNEINYFTQHQTNS